MKKLFSTILIACLIAFFAVNGWSATMVDDFDRIYPDRTYSIEVGDLIPGVQEVCFIFHDKGRPGKGCLRTDHMYPDMLFKIMDRIKERGLIYEN